MDRTGSLVGKTALVTGGTSGIGYHTAIALARLGAVVYITGRDASRGQDAAGRLRAAAGHDGVHFVRADHSTVGGNQELARRLLAEAGRLDILVNNVGGLYNDRRTTADGYEATVAMNFVGPFALTGSLLPALRRSVPARVVNVTSAAHEMWKDDPFTDVHSEAAYLGLHAYARSKLLNLMWTLALARRLENSEITVNATNPGMAWTSMTAGIERRAMTGFARMLWPLFRWIQRQGSPEKAASSSIFLASSPAVAGVTGTYIESDLRRKDPAPAARDRSNQEKAWELAESLVRSAPTALKGNHAIAGETGTRAPEA